MVSAFISPRKSVALQLEDSKNDLVCDRSADQQVVRGAGFGVSSHEDYCMAPHLFSLSAISIRLVCSEEP